MSSSYDAINRARVVRRQALLKHVAPIVLRSRSAGRCTCEDFAVALNSAGVKTGYGLKWSANSVWAFLRWAATVDPNLRPDTKREAAERRHGRRPKKAAASAIGFNDAPSWFRLPGGFGA